jgi:adenylylsulfate kinase-like enzyme
LLGQLKIWSRYILEKALQLIRKRELESSGLTVKIIDGDTIREGYKEKLGFGREDIKK